MKDAKTKCVVRLDDISVDAEMAKVAEAVERVDAITARIERQHRKYLICFQCKILCLNFAITVLEMKNDDEIASYYNNDDDALLASLPEPDSEPAVNGKGVYDKCVNIVFNPFLFSRF